MATHLGSEGTIAVGANIVAEIKNYTYTETAATVSDTSLGDEWDTKLAGTKSWTASVECHWDETDTNGQEALTVGSSATFNFYPEGNTAGDTYRTGTGIITSVGVNVAGNDEVTSRSYSVEGSGALTQSTVV